MLLIGFFAGLKDLPQFYLPEKIIFFAFYSIIRFLIILFLGIQLTGIAKNEYIHF